MDMTRLQKQLRIDEGQVKKKNRHVVYQDSEGHDTVGIGRLVSRGFSNAEVTMMLHSDINDAIADLRRKFWWFDNLDDIRQEVVINMVFNLGIDRFSGFRKTIDYISQEEFILAAAEMLDSEWAVQVGNRAQRLSRMMASGLENGDDN